MPAPRIFPSGSKYAEAIQNPGLCFLDPDLRGGRVELNKLGQPKPISGNFASVFSVTAASGRRFAVKCFTRDVNDQRARYEAISRHLAGIDAGALSQPWKMEFNYLPDGILVDGARWPVLKMAWVDGIGLLRWLERHHRDSAAVGNLAVRFAALVADLEKAHIGHGDLQHGNLLVAADGGLRLVDYDGMYVPALAASRAVEDGHRHYQPPLRTAADFGETIDRFSSWVIYLALTALAADPSLWDSLRDPDAEYLLTSDEDYKSPASSWRLSRLTTAGPQIGPLAAYVRELAGKPVASIPRLTPLGPSAGVPTAPAAGLGTTSSGSARPAWLDEHLGRQQPQAPLTPGPSVTTPRRFTGRRPIDLLAALAALATTIPAFLAALVLPALAPAFLAVVLFGVSLLEAGRRSRREWRSWHAANKALLAGLRAQGDPDKDLRRLELRYDKDIHAIVQADAKNAKDQQGLAARRNAELAQIDRATAGRVSAMDREKRELERRRDEQLKDTLDRLRQELVDASLRRHSIEREVKDIRGLGPGAARALAEIGVRTAADVDIRFVQSSGYASSMAYFIRPGGGQTRVSGIGEAKARALLSWRDGLAREAGRSAPAALPAAVAAQIRSITAKRIAVLDAAHAASEAKARDEKVSVNVRISQESARLSAEQRQLVDQRAHYASSYRAAQAEIRHRSAEQSRLREALAAERPTRRDISRRRYFLFALLNKTT